MPSAPSDDHPKKLRFSGAPAQELSPKVTEGEIMQPLGSLLPALRATSPVPEGCSSDGGMGMRVPCRGRRPRRPACIVAAFADAGFMTLRRERPLCRSESMAAKAEWHGGHSLQVLKCQAVVAVTNVASRRASCRGRLWRPAKHSSADVSAGAACISPPKYQFLFRFILFPQLHAADLAADGLGKFFHELDLARVLVWRGHVLHMLL